MVSHRLTEVQHTDPASPRTGLGKKEKIHAAYDRALSRSCGGMGDALGPAGYVFGQESIQNKKNQN